jgi:hypothetical protein
MAYEQCGRRYVERREQRMLYPSIQSDDLRMDGTIFALVCLVAKWPALCLASLLLSEPLQPPASHCGDRGKAFSSERERYVLK